MKNIEFHIGPRNCGKSEYVENQLLEYTDKVYIATLPCLPVYNNTIITHQNRRGTGWHTVELAHQLEEDFLTIEHALSKMPKNTACMIDGLSVWYTFINSNDGTGLDTFIRKLSKLVLTYHMEWRLVDVCASMFSENLEVNKACEYMHKQLIEKIDIQKIIDWRYEKI